MSKKIISQFKLPDGNSLKLEYAESLPSTADLARRYAQNGYPDRYVVITEKQSSSILGNKLSDGEFESGLFMSCILRPSLFPSQASLVGPLSAVALAIALEEHTTKKMSIGWVSDIFCEGKKIGGCSVEGKLDNFTSYEYMIINFAVKLDENNFPPRLSDMVRKVFETGNHSIAIIIAKTILTKFFAIYRDVKSPEKHMNQYENRFALFNKKIKFIENDKKNTIKVTGFDKEDCTLIATTKNGALIKITSPSSVIIPKNL